jgi:hypothetical protein
LGITVELAEKPVSCSANLLKTLSRVLSYISVCTATPKDPIFTPKIVLDIDGLQVKQSAGFKESRALSERCVQHRGRAPVISINGNWRAM